LFILLLITAINLIKINERAREAIVTLSLISIIFYFFNEISYFAGFYFLKEFYFVGFSFWKGFSIVSVLFLVVYRGIVIWYFNQKKIKDYFQLKNRTPALVKP